MNNEIMDTYEIIEFAKQLSDIQFEAYCIMNLNSAPNDKKEYQRMIDLCWNLIPIELKDAIKEYPEICEVADEEFNCHVIAEACVQYLNISW